MGPIGRKKSHGRAGLSFRSFAVTLAVGLGVACADSVCFALVAGPLKARLLAAVASGRKEEIFAAAEALERLDCTEASVGGRWSLVYSTQTQGSDEEQSFLGAINGALYRGFFRFAPFLAGGQENVLQAIGPFGFSVGNEQLVDVVNKRVDNRVALRFGPGKGVKLNVQVIGELEGKDERDLAITFTSFKVPPSLELPLPRPTGRLRTTFCDSTMRLSRGGRGGLFVLRRLDR